MVLPLSIVEIVLQNLQNPRKYKQVCRDWHSIIEKKQMQKIEDTTNLDLGLIQKYKNQIHEINFRDDYFNLPIFEEILSQSERLRSIKINAEYIDTIRTIQPLLLDIKNKGGVRELELNIYYSLHKNYIISLLSCFPNLVSISICILQDEKLIMDKLAKFKHLKYLYLTLLNYNPDLVYRIVREIKLIDLSLDFINNSRNHSSPLLPLDEKMTGLKSLKLKGEAYFSLCASQFPKLTCLELQNKRNEFKGNWENKFNILRLYEVNLYMIEQVGDGLKELSINSNFIDLYTLPCKDNLTSLFLHSNTLTIKDMNLLSVKYLNLKEIGMRTLKESEETKLIGPKIVKLWFYKFESSSIDILEFILGQISCIHIGHSYFLLQYLYKTRPELNVESYLD